VGLFGTCDGSDWRDQFEIEYRRRGIPFFNPVRDDWENNAERYMREEAAHLANDQIVLFPILSWSLGQGSLSEFGFGPLRALLQNKHRSFVVLIDQELHPRLDDVDPDRRKDSLRSRKLVLSKIREYKLPNVYLVKNLAQMLGVSLRLYEAHQTLAEVEAVVADAG